MKKLLLSKDELAETIYHQQLTRKKNLLSDAVKLCEKYITIESMDEFKESFISYIEKGIRFKSKLDGVNTEKLFSLYDIPSQSIRNLEMSYKGINIDLNQPIPDFNIYATSVDGIAHIRKLQALCDALNELKVISDWMNIQRSLNQEISFDAVWKINAHTYKENWNEKG